MFEPPVQRLIDELARLPGVGVKSAQRLAFHILIMEEADALRLADAITELRRDVRLCSRCFNVTGEEECSICRDTRRDPTVVCVVGAAPGHCRGRSNPGSFMVATTSSAEPSRPSRASDPTSCTSRSWSLALRMKGSKR